MPVAMPEYEEEEEEEEVGYEPDVQVGATPSMRIPSTCPK
jgi:hypothetical protein